MSASAIHYTPVPGKSRRREVRNVLARFRVGRGPMIPDAHRDAAAALQLLGPTFVAFGHYLSTRPDLISPQLSCQLASPMAPPFTHPRTEIPGLTIERQPFECTFACQSYYGASTDGRRIVVRIARPGLADLLDGEAPMLRLLTHVLPDTPFESAIEDFVRTAHRQSDLAQEAEALRQLAREARSSGAFRVPEVLDEFCSTGRLVIERLDGAPFAGWHQRFCTAWLRQALEGSIYPAEPRRENRLLLANGEIAFVRGPFEVLPRISAANLMTYLVAAAAQDPDRACRSLTADMDSRGYPANYDQLLPRFRQMVPYRDSEWASPREAEGLIDHVIAHWRVCREHGFAPSNALMDFLRGLFILTRGAPGPALREAVAEVYGTSVLEQIREVVSLNRMAELDRYLTVMMELPTRLEEALSRAAESRSAEPEKTTNQSGYIFAAVLALIALALVRPHFDASSAAALIFAGALLLLQPRGVP